eukprot:TRINITY_DN23987_c0_g1_i1.p1 TRINITY_DN23987_c0_g1~~TRINITY_DN23987_c0_g1_i1.p1  ORF type:complete len:241 (+),score=50.36 TRINITY_DN23987_c0_g1_i1:88-723(+)
MCRERTPAAAPQQQQEQPASEGEPAACTSSDGDHGHAPSTACCGAVPAAGFRWADDDPEKSQMDFALPPERFLRRQRTPPPCPHNDWKKVGKKRERLVLMCRREDCLREADGGRTVWRIFPGEYGKCRDFYRGSCPRGASCPHPHIHKTFGESRGAARVYCVTRGHVTGVFVGDYADVVQHVAGYKGAVFTRHDSVEKAEERLRAVFSQSA